MKEILGFLLLSFLIILGFLWLYIQIRNFMEKRLGENLLSVKEKIQDLGEIRRDIQKLYLAEELLKGLKEELSKLSQIFLSRRAGKAGERGLEEILSPLPTHLLKRDLKLSGGEVEFALSLDHNKYIPIDSKFIAPEILSKEELSPEEERELLKRIKLRAQEIVPYLKDERTIGLAIMTCPDGLFPYLQRRIFEELEKWGILLVPYSFLLPVLLFIHFFWNKFGRELDRDSLAQRISKIENFLFTLDRDLERLSRELKSVENLLVKIREYHRALQRELNLIKETTYREINSKGT
ncbi:MAG: DNA recombination protein RmuC [Caldimicrobium sp.]|nr:DNA recombination protein RmuC [Caldimicrobium sp.]MCX7873150.1 DNA recombination protein RmuC [Caldimicrobium sp.]MDW8094272.1 DNA recombination protein RmuC [Caldimicrobium sp.]